MATISQQAKQTIKATLDGVTSDQKAGVAGLSFTAVNRKGEYLVQEASGTHGLNDTTPMTPESIFYVASCTKMITGLACMQLVEQGKLQLDDHESLYKLCPELKDKQVLNSTGKLVPRQGEITLRKLLTHTAGFGYSFFNHGLRNHGLPAGYNEFAGDAEDYLNQPLVNQPGSRWEYGINIDWAGIAVERASGLRLDAYFKQNIFEPLGIKNVSTLPDQSMRDNLVRTHYRGPDGRVVERDCLARRSVSIDDKRKDSLFQSGGAGGFAQPSEYCKIMATLLNDGKSPTTGKQILKPETVKEMFTNQIPEMPDFARTLIPAAIPELTNPIPQLYPQQGNPQQGWGLTFMITVEPGATGRGRNTAWWAGLINCFWWIDREKGVAGFIAGQMLPFADAAIMGTWAACEKAVYDGLTSAQENDTKL